MASKPTVPGLARGLRVIETLAKDPYELSLSELAESLDIPQASLWRILKTLRDEGYVLVDKRRKTYRLGFKFLYMGSVMLSGAHFRTPGKELLKRLAEKTGETAEIDTRVRTQLIIVEQVPGPNAVYSYSYPGSVMPYFHATAPGKVYLAHISSEKLRSVIKKIGLPKLTPYTIQDIDQLEKEIKKVQIDGYAVDIEEMREGVGRVAAPIYDEYGKVIACVAIVCPPFRLNDQNKKYEYGLEAKKFAIAMSKEFYSDLQAANSGH